jgi:hypothetical protein
LGAKKAHGTHRLRHGAPVVATHERGDARLQLGLFAEKGARRAGRVDAEVARFRDVFEDVQQVVRRPLGENCEKAPP